MLQIWLFKEIKRHQNLLKNFHIIKEPEYPKKTHTGIRTNSEPLLQGDCADYCTTVFYFKGPTLLVSSTRNPARFSLQPGKHLLSPAITISFVKPGHDRKPNWIVGRAGLGSRPLPYMMCNAYKISNLYALHSQLLGVIRTPFQ